jgi:hypothetical protein
MNMFQGLRRPPKKAASCIVTVNIRASEYLIALAATGERAGVTGKRFLESVSSFPRATGLA